MLQGEVDVILDLVALVRKQVSHDLSSAWPSPLCT